MAERLAAFIERIQNTHFVTYCGWMTWHMVIYCNVHSQDSICLINNTKIVTYKWCELGDVCKCCFTQHQFWLKLHAPKREKAIRIWNQLWIRVHDLIWREKKLLFLGMFLSLIIHILSATTNSFRPQWVDGGVEAKMHTQGGPLHTNT